MFSYSTFFALRIYIFNSSASVKISLFKSPLRNPAYKMLPKIFGLLFSSFLIQLYYTHNIFSTIQLLLKKLQFLYLSVFCATMLIPCCRKSLSFLILNYKYSVSHFWLGVFLFIIYYIHNILLQISFFCLEEFSFSI